MIALIHAEITEITAADGIEKHRHPPDVRSTLRVEVSDNSQGTTNQVKRSNQVKDKKDGKDGEMERSSLIGRACENHGDHPLRHCQELRRVHYAFV